MLEIYIRDSTKIDMLNEDVLTGSIISKIFFRTTGMNMLVV